MRFSVTGRNLLEAISEMEIIDAHQHLPAEEEYLAFQYSGLNMFAGYLQHDLASAGLPPEFKATLREGGFKPVEQWWPVIRPHWENVKHGSYGRALRITARDLWGLADVDDTTIHALAGAVMAGNTPGLYRRVLRERCRARLSITCVDQPAFPRDPGLRGITMLIKSAGSPRAIADELTRRTGREVKTLDDAVAAAQGLLRAERAAGAVGFKTHARHHDAPDPAEAEKQWRQGMAAGPDAPASAAVNDLIFDRGLDVAAETDAVVALHSGYWGDFRLLDPKHLLGFAARRGDVRFDLFHLGAPMLRDAMLIGKNLPNVTLNLTWLPIISQTQARRCLDELIDLAPMNKIIAFGGDYRVCVQKTWGHLVLAREAVAEALAARVDAGEFDQAEALRLARMWFCGNPSRIYGV